MEREIIVKEAMKMKPVVVEPKISVLEAARLMKNKKIGNVLVVEKNQPIGILTESDIIKKVVAEGKNAKSVPVEEVMTTPVLVTDPYIPVDEAMKTMGKCNIRRLPVVENDKLIGIITQKDISRLSPLLNEISREWYNISKKDEAHLRSQIFSGKCEDCNSLSSNLKNVDGRLLCEDCIDELEYQ